MALLWPFLIGGMLALALNVPLRAVESRLPRTMRFRREIALGAVLFLAGAVLVILFALVVPQLLESGTALGQAVPDFWARTQAWAKQKARTMPLMQAMLGGVDLPELKELLGQEASWLRSGRWMGGTVNAAAQFVSAAADFGVGAVLAAYLLARKEQLARQACGVLDAWLPGAAAENIKHIAGVFGAAFSAFFSGQCLEAALLGCIFAFALWVCRFPCVALISSLIGVTALVPIFGTFVGCAFGTIVILALEPQKMIWFLVLFFCIQQLEGAFLYPRVVGSKIGLPPLWVLVAVTLGGKLFGAVGMLAMIPIFGALYALAKEKTCEKLKNRKK